MSEFTIKGETFDKRVKRLYTKCTALNIAKAAEPALVEEVEKASLTLGKNIKHKEINKDEAHLYINEKSLQFANKVPGNRNPKPISSNKLAGILNKGTPPHPITAKSAKMLHFMGGNQRGGANLNSDVFVKQVNHPGTKAQEFWKINSKMKESFGKFVDTELKEAFGK